jgi:hypothetical protein
VPPAGPSAWIALAVSVQKHRKQVDMYCKKPLLCDYEYHEMRQKMFIIGKN